MSVLLRGVRGSTYLTYIPKKLESPLPPRIKFVHYMMILYWECVFRWGDSGLYNPREGVPHIADQVRTAKAFVDDLKSQVFVFLAGPL